MKTFKKSKMEEKMRNLMNTEKNKISFGAECINKVITLPKGDNWRRKQKVKKQQKHK